MELQLISLNLVSNRLRKKYKIKNINWDGKELYIESDYSVPTEAVSEIKTQLGLEMSYNVFSDKHLEGNEVLECFFEDAFLKRATDIHFEPVDMGVRVRIRIDGYLHTVDTICLEEYDRMIRVIKIQGNMDISENRLPQEGGFRHESRGYDIRVSIIPSLYGEKTVLRILPVENKFKNLDKLGMSKQQLDIIEKALQKRSGSIIVNGPTGSGKSTTLHAILNEVNKSVQSVLSIEDPIEIIDHDITQFQVNEALGLTYAEYLKRVLRQDPDIIYLGEIRDTETARLACEASLTGHYLLSTIHTKTTSDVILRMLEMGIEPFLISGSIDLIINQRLIRRNCPMCSKKVSVKKEYQQLFGITEEVKGSGCKHCNNTGYYGRIGLFEINEVTEKTKASIFSFQNNHNIENCLSDFNEGIGISLVDHAKYLLKNGMTNCQEILPCL
ncbi:MAG: type II/IV secretion system protein [Caldisericia bacterium]|nr:type II/IV secretion system protein [Caldisericia bacterium]